jgi:hypothetical protein
VLIDHHHIAVPVGRMKVETVAHGHAIPAQMLALRDLNSRIVAEDVSVDGELMVHQREAVAHREIGVAARSSSGTTSNLLIDLGSPT